MFTGIVEETGTVTRTDRRGDVLVARIEAGKILETMPQGGSIAVNGCCLTAVEVGRRHFVCDLTEETLARTAFEEVDPRLVGLARTLGCGPMAAFRRVPQPTFSVLRERLFTQWRELVAEKSVGHFLYEGYGSTKKPHWVHALADAVWEGEGSQASFCASLRQWLKAAEENTETLRRSERALARLSLDLDSHSWLSPVSPTLERLLAYGWSDDPALRVSRRKWLERLGAASLVPELLAFWKRNVQRLVPDPGHSGGTDYKSCADWAKALWEMNQPSCKELLHQWSVVHHRRRNLWRALRAKGLPCDLGR